MSSTKKLIVDQLPFRVSLHSDSLDDMVPFMAVSYNREKEMFGLQIPGGEVHYIKTFELLKLTSILIALVSEVQEKEDKQ